MITQVSLKGFQSHVDSQFHLGQGLNVITGPSDAGKTAVIRAVRWVAFNEPQGEAFVNEVVGEAEVKLFLSDRSIITKTRRKGKTSYLIQQDEHDEGSIFEKSEVPLEVKRLLGIEKHSFGDFEAALNFSFQLDAPFLISETASAGAKVLGKLAGTESVDLAIKGVSKDTYAARQLRTQAEKDMERIAGNLFEYEGIDDAKQMLETAEMLLEQVEESKDKLDNLKHYDLVFQEVEERIEHLFEKLDKLSVVPDLEKDLQDIEKAQQRYDLLLQLYSDGSRLLNRIEELSARLNRYQDVQAANEVIRSTETAAERLSTNILLRQSYQKYTDDVKRANEVLKRTEDLNLVSECLKTAEKNIYELNELRSLKNEYTNAHRQNVLAQNRLHSFNSLPAAEDIIITAESDYDQFKTLSSLHQQYKEALKNFDIANLRQGVSINNLEKAESELQQAWSETDGVCPLCEQPHEKGVC